MDLLCSFTGTNWGIFSYVIAALGMCTEHISFSHICLFSPLPTVAHFIFIGVQKFTGQKVNFLKPI